jgi:hypothetical protein
MLAGVLGQHALTVRCCDASASGFRHRERGKRVRSVIADDDFATWLE